MHVDISVLFKKQTVCKVLNRFQLGKYLVAYVLSPKYFFYLAFQCGASFVDPFLSLMFHLCHAVLSVPCCLMVTCCERVDLFALLYVMFCCVFVNFPYLVPGQVWYLILLYTYTD